MNMREALDLYLEEAESSKVVFPPPVRAAKSRNVVPIEVDREWHSRFSCGSLDFARE